MKLIHFARSLRGAMILAAAVGISVVLTAVQVTGAQSSEGFSFLQPGGTYTVGDVMTVTIHENSGSSLTNAAAVDFTYPANLLQFVGSDSTDSSFPVTALDRGGNGTVNFHRGAKSPVSGDQVVERAIFKVIGSGTAVLTFSGSTVAVSSDDNHTNVAPGKANASYTLNQPAPTPTPIPTPGPSPSPAPPGPAPSPPPRPAPKPTIIVTPTTTSNNKTTSTDTSIPLTPDQTIELTTPADIQPATNQSDGISKVEYYLNGKLIKTVAVSPFTYRLDTTNMLNGTYRLTTKTYYTNGETSSTTQKVVVKNAFGATQLKLLMQKYIFLIILVILLIIGVVIALIIRKSMKGGGDDYYTGYDTGYTPPVNPPTTISPSGTQPPAGNV